MDVKNTGTNDSITHLRDSREGSKKYNTKNNPGKCHGNALARVDSGLLSE